MHEVKKWSSVYHAEFQWGTVTSMMPDGVAVVTFDEDPPDTYRYMPVNELTHTRDWQPEEPDGPDPIRSV